MLASLFYRLMATEYAVLCLYRQCKRLIKLVPSLVYCSARHPPTVWTPLPQLSLPAFVCVYFCVQLSDLFEDGDEDEADTATDIQEQPPSETSPATAAPPSPPPPVAAAPVTQEAVEVDEGTPEGQFSKLSGGTGGVLTFDALLG